jgi:hypothetical protein
MSGNAGTYYLVCPKKGKIRAESLRRPFGQFSVSPDWITTLVSSDKMTVADARLETIQAGRSLHRKLADLDLLQRCREELRLQARVSEVQRELAKRSLPSRVIPEIEAWKESALAPFQARKKFLVIEGPSGLGKTAYVRQLCGPEATLELNAAGSGTCPDLRQHNAALHKIILFDEGSPLMVLSNKKLFQCPACMVDLGHSPTGTHVYKVWVNDSALIIASNLWSAQVASLESKADREWLAANSIVVAVSEPMWAPPAAPDARDD